MKTIVILMTGLCSVIFARAQQYISIGPTAGFGHSWVSMDQEPSGYDKAFHASYNIGAKLVYSIETHWGISADVKFSSEGGTFKSVSGNDKQVLRANYIRVPFQGIYFFGDYGDRVRPKLATGPTFGFLVGGKSKSIVNEQTSSETAISNVMKGFDFGWNFAGGANVRLARNTWLNADLLYNLGITDVSKSSNAIRNRGLGFNVGVAFGIDVP